MLSRIEATIKKHDLFTQTDRILVAVSGGPDSVFLAWALQELGYEIGIAHVNYQLRGEESEAEEELVKKMASVRKLPIHLARFPTKELVEQDSNSLQMVARKLRYDFFEEIIRKKGYTCCATAHHRDDQVETILMSMVKGNSSFWMTGIPPKRGVFVRPLIEVSKQAIISELDLQKVPYAIDSSNLKSDYTRNKIRNQMMPLLAEINPSIVTQIVDRYAWHCRQQKLLTHQLEAWYAAFVSKSPQHKHLDLEAFESAGNGDWSDLLLVFSLEKWGLHGHEVWEGLRLLKSNSGKQLNGSYGKIIRDRKGFTWQPVSQTVPNPIVIEQVEKTIEQKFKGRKFRYSVVHKVEVAFDTPDTYFLDANKIKYPIKLRNWKVGDRMVPFGMKHPKKLSDIFTDEKYSPIQKDRAIVIEDAEKIICLSEFRISDAVRIDEDTVFVLKINIE